MIQVDHIDFVYPSGGHKVFSDFSLSLKENNIYGLLGKNGTGKSTLLYLLSGLLAPSDGTVLVDGYCAENRDPRMLADIFMVMEEFQLPDVTLSTYVDMNRPFYPNFSQEVLDNCLRDFEMPLSLNLSQLSMGQKKKAYMSFAIAAGTRYLFMDEPTNGLDIPSKRNFRKVITRNMSPERTLVISTHQLHDVESLLGHIVVMDQSHLLLDSAMDEIRAKYTFEYRQPQEMDDTVLYAEPTLQGNAVVRLRKPDEPVSQVNLELLFNAVYEGKIPAADNTIR